MAKEVNNSDVSPSWQIGFALAGLFVLLRILFSILHPSPDPVKVPLTIEETLVKVGLWAKVPTDARREILHFNAPTNGLTYLVATNGNISNPTRFKGDAGPDITDWGNGITCLHFSLDHDQLETNSVVYISREPR